MKKTFSLLLTLLVLIFCMNGCKSRPNEPTSTVPLPPPTMLPAALHIAQEGSEATVQLTWTETTCSFQMEQTTYLFAYEGNTLTLYDDVERNHQLLQYTFDEDGYITAMILSGSDQAGTVTYNPEHTAFTMEWEIGSFQGVASGEKVDFIWPDIMRLSFGYNNCFVTSISDDTGMAYSYQPEADAAGTLEKLVCTRGDSALATVTATASNMEQTQPWQRIPVLYLLQSSFGMTKLIMVMSSMTACYIPV